MRSRWHKLGFGLLSHQEPVQLIVGRRRRTCLRQSEKGTGQPHTGLLLSAGCLLHLGSRHHGHTGQPGTASVLFQFTVEWQPFEIGMMGSRWGVGLVCARGGLSTKPLLKRVGRFNLISKPKRLAIVQGAFRPNPEYKE